MTTEDAKTVAGFLADDFAEEMETTLRVLAAVPGDRLDYRPDPVSSSALILIRHIPLLDAWLLNSIADGRFEPPPRHNDSSGIFTPEASVAYYRERVPPALDRVRGLTGEQLAANLDFFGLMQLPAVQFLARAVKHSVHHRGQLSAYLRAMGGKVPSIYGRTAGA